MSKKEKTKAATASVDLKRSAVREKSPVAVFQRKFFYFL